MHPKRTEHGRCCLQNNELVTKSFIETKVSLSLKDKSNAMEFVLYFFGLGEYGSDEYILSGLSMCQSMLLTMMLFVHYKRSSQFVPPLGFLTR